MRRHRELRLYQSILQILGEVGCPFCFFLKAFQASRLQNHARDDLHHLCNFHVWGLAAVQDAPDAAEIFLQLIDEAAILSNDTAECDICRQVMAEEDLRVREFVSCITRPELSRWFSADPLLCIPHGIKLRQKVPTVYVHRIDSIIDGCREKLTGDLRHLRDEREPMPERTGWGAVGRAAEFLVCPRGLRP
jgi:hypothetical protein